MKKQTNVNQSISSPEKAFLCKGLEISNYLDLDFKAEMEQDVREGLSCSQKRLPSKYFYNSDGSKLFDQISCLAEYYPTRTELGILENAAEEIMTFFERGRGDLVEIGSGSDLKIRRLFDSVSPLMRRRIRYVPVDISESCLIEAAQNLLGDYPGLTIHGIVADFTGDLRGLERSPKLVTFFGSTIGNFPDQEGIDLLCGFAKLMNPEDRLLIGLDMIKPVPVIEAAYNDACGITAEFNLNILRNINQTLDADFNLDHFTHKAFFNPEKEQIEMHLQAIETTSAYVPAIDMTVRLECDETIHTEVSRKYNRQNAEEIITKAGFSVSRWYTDTRGWFSLVELEKNG